MTYSIVVRTYPSSSSGNGRFRRPVRILVVQGPVKAQYRRGDPDVLREWSNVDSRYQGPRSAYGQAMAEASDMVYRLRARSAEYALAAV